MFLQESNFDIGVKDDPLSLQEAIRSVDLARWQDVMLDELESMKHNHVWDLAQLPQGVKPIKYRWVYKTKQDSKGKVERYKARLVAKGFTEREGVDYNETFSPVSRKDSFRTIMALTPHFDFELHQVDVKTAFLNGDLEEEVYMTQPEGFINADALDTVCKLNRSIYSL